MNLAFKALIYLVLFSVLHFVFDLTDWSFLRPFCGVDESVFQHLKMAFWAYLLATLVEYRLIKKKKIVSRNFW